MIVISPYVLHRHRMLWDDPDRFDPGRFLDGAPRTVDRYAYLPFGVGPRMCIGAGFALQEATIVLATIMKHFTPALAPDQTVWPLQRFTLRPRDPLIDDHDAARLSPSTARRVLDRGTYWLGAGPAAAWTTIVPVMCGCRLQKYS
jgi:Cytochrome P450